MFRNRKRNVATAASIHSFGNDDFSYDFLQAEQKFNYIENGRTLCSGLDLNFRLMLSPPPPPPPKIALLIQMNPGERSNFATFEIHIADLQMPFEYGKK